MSILQLSVAIGFFGRIRRIRPDTEKVHVSIESERHSIRPTYRRPCTLISDRKASAQCAAHNGAHDPPHRSEPQWRITMAARQPPPARLRSVGAERERTNSPIMTQSLFHHYVPDRGRNNLKQYNKHRGISRATRLSTVIKWSD